MDRLSELRNRITALCTACCVLALTACSDDTTGDDSLPDGRYPMTFTTTVQGLTQTRATVNNQWDGTEKVAIMAGNTVKKYMAESDGALTPDGDNQLYWTSNTMTVQAWYSAVDSDTRPENFTVKQDQNSDGGYQRSDMLYTIQSVSYSGGSPASLEFKHLPAKVVVNLKADTQTGITEEEARNATVTLVNQALTSGTIIVDEKATTCTVAQVVSGSEEIIPQKSGQTASGYQQTVQALVVPQQMKDKFIKVTIGTDAAARNYYYTPTTEADGKLEAGYQYTYNITVKNGYLEVVIAKANGAWDSSEISENVTSKIVDKIFTENDLKVGDYFYRTANGKWVTSDGGLRKIYTDGSVEMLDIEPVQTDLNGKLTCIGIVYWVGDPTTITPANKAADIGDKSKLQGDKILNEDHSDCTHGLVVSLDEVYVKEWQRSNTSVQDWLNKNRPNDFLSVQGEKDESDALNNIQGYNNTKAIEAFNRSSSETVYVVEKVIQYRKEVAAPTNSSGWYVPSIKELTLLRGKDVNNIFVNYADYTNYALINRKLDLIGADILGLGDSFSYYSSTERDYFRVHGVYIWKGDLLPLGKNSNSASYVRFSLAF